MTSINLNVLNSDNYIKIDISTEKNDGTTEKIMTLNLPKNILKHDFNFDNNLKKLLKSHVAGNERMESIKSKKSGKEYRIVKKQYKNAFNDQDVEKLAHWMIDAFVKSKYKGGIDAYVFKKYDNY